MTDKIKYGYTVLFQFPKNDNNPAYWESKNRKIYETPEIAESAINDHERKMYNIKIVPLYIDAIERLGNVKRRELNQGI
jgi:hypothetical protein